MRASNNNRSYPQSPIVGVAAVVWRDARVLLVRRGRPPRQGQWSLPGGAQHLGETVFCAAQREVLEETGLAITVLGLVDVVDSIQTDHAGKVQYHYTLVELAAEAHAGTAVAGDDATAVGWFSLAELADLGLWVETERVIRKSVELRQGGPVPGADQSPPAGH
jgi:ADP-ribose pyrophosphatase YjhB (NUDIX family)